MPPPQSPALALRDSSAGTAAKQEVIAIITDSEKTKFLVHKVLLLYHSEYFKRALNDPWKEAEEGVVRLEDVETDTFTIFVHWLYHQTLTSDSDWWTAMFPEVDDGNRIDELKPITIDYINFLCIKAYAFGVRFAADSFRRTVMTVFDANYADGMLMHQYGRQAVAYAFDNIPSDRAILERMVEDYCDTMDLRDSSYALDAMKDLPLAFLRRVIALLNDRSHEYEEENPSKCYLEHEDDDKKAECGKPHMVYDEKLGQAIFTKTKKSKKEKH